MKTAQTTSSDPLDYLTCQGVLTAREQAEGAVIVRRCFGFTHDPRTSQRPITESVAREIERLEALEKSQQDAEAL